MKFNSDIKDIFEKSAKIILDSKILDKQIDASVSLIISAIKTGKKIIIFGNGGSASDSQHMAGEFIGRYLLERKRFPAIALTTDTSILTAIGNDYGFEKIFSRQCEGLVKKGDIVIVISTSGTSKNILQGISTAKKLGAKTISLCGKNTSKIKKYSDIVIAVPSIETPRIQESHRTIIHIICQIVEKQLKNI